MVAIVATKHRLATKIGTMFQLHPKPPKTTAGSTYPPPLDVAAATALQSPRPGTPIDCENLGLGGVPPFTISLALLP